MQDSIKQKESLSSNSLRINPIDFISAGVGCNCLVVLDESGILKNILSCGYLSEKEIETYANPTCINAAVVTLEKCGILKKELGCLKLTEFGRSISEYMGLINIFFDGYSGLVANQAEIVKVGKSHNLEKLVKWASVSKSSIQISEQRLDPVILKEIADLKVSGTICDLGCGHGTMLSKICSQIGNCGLGFESYLQTVEEARKQAHSKVKIELADITNLQGVWEDVVVLMQAFVFHDFNPESKCVDIMNSYLKNFPNLSQFLYIDIVTPSAAKPDLFPGFDYVHGLLGIPTRTYEQTLEMFSQSSYEVQKEVSITGLPNTFLWILSPK